MHCFRLGTVNAAIAAAIFLTAVAAMYWSQYSGLEDWQSWRRTSSTPIAAFPAEPSAEMAQNRPIWHAEFAEIAANFALRARFSVLYWLRRCLKALPDTNDIKHISALHLTID